MAVLAAGCCGASTQSPTASADKTETSTQTPTSSSSATVDTSVADKLTAAGVPPALVHRLIATADSHGYGPADEAFASLMVDVCRDVHVGYKKWDELIAQDEADGASASAADAFNDFLRDEFCPQVKPATDTAPPARRRPRLRSPASHADCSRTPQC
jgi:hypothetical protein